MGQHSEGADPLHQGFADFAQFDSQPDCDAFPRRHGAFEVYRKPTPSMQFLSFSLMLLFSFLNREANKFL